MRHDCDKGGCYMRRHVVNFGGTRDIPNLVRSTNPAYSMTIANSASSPLTLKIMLSALLHPVFKDSAVMCVEVIGKAGVPTVEKVRLYQDGQQSDWIHTTLDGLRRSIENWIRDKENRWSNTA